MRRRECGREEGKGGRKKGGKAKKADRKITL